MDRPCEVCLYLPVPIAKIRIAAVTSMTSSEVVKSKHPRHKPLFIAVYTGNTDKHCILIRLYPSGKDMSECIEAMHKKAVLFNIYSVTCLSSRTFILKQCPELIRSNLNTVIICIIIKCIHIITIFLHAAEYLHTGK